MFELSQRKEDGKTVAEHLKAVEKRVRERLPREQQASFVLPELALPPFPHLLWREWDWFVRMHARRTNNGFGPNPLTFSEMQAFFHLIGEKPSRRQLDLLVVLDNAALNALAGGKSAG